MRISVIMRSWNDIDTIEPTLAMLYRQTIRDFELVSLDQWSTDGTAEVLRRFMKEGRFLERTPGPYSPGAVLNQGVEGSRGDILVFLNSDATPVDERWLEHLIRPLEDPGVGAVYGRQVARPDARPGVRRDYEWAFPASGAGAERRGIIGSSSSDCFFSMAASATRREVAERVPFRPEVRYSEDIVWAREVREAGWTVAYAAEAAVYHSHNYTFGEAWRRFRGEGVTDGEMFAPRRGKDNLVTFACLPFASAVARDLVYLARRGQLSPGEITYAVQNRWAQKFARYAGLREGRARRRGKGGG